MKRKISKEDFDKLSDSQKVEYEEKNGSYFLKLEDEDDAVSALRQAKENESNAHKETKNKLKELEKKLEEITGEKHRKDGDVEAIEKSWQEKYNKREGELLGENGKFKSILVGTAKDGLLTTLASKLAKSDSHRLFKKGIEDRVSVEYDGEKVVTRILDKDGKPSAMTVEDFEKEILANKEFSSILVASKASGSGGPVKPNVPGAGGPNTNSEPKTDYANLAPSKLAEILTARIAANKGE